MVTPMVDIEMRNREGLGGKHTQGMSYGSGGDGRHLDKDS